MTRMAGVPDWPAGGMDMPARGVHGEIDGSEAATEFPNLLSRLTASTASKAGNAAPAVPEIGRKSCDRPAVRRLLPPVQIGDEGVVADAVDGAVPAAPEGGAPGALRQSPQADRKMETVPQALVPALEDAWPVAGRDDPGVDENGATGARLDPPPAMLQAGADWDGGLQAAGQVSASAILAVTLADARPTLQPKREAAAANPARAALQAAIPDGAGRPITSTEPVLGAEWPQAARGAAGIEGDADPQPSDLPVFPGGGDIKVGVLRSETHVLPPGYGQAALQIAERIGAELDLADSAPPAMTDPKAASAASRPDAVVKVLHIQLQPVELGIVTVRMSLKQDVLNIQLETSRQATAHVLQHDRDKLAKALHTAGYSIEGLTVQIAEPDRLAALPGQSSLQGAQTSLASSTAPNSGGSQHGSGAPGGHGRAQGETGSAVATPAAAQPNDRLAGGGGLYL